MEYDNILQRLKQITDGSAGSAGSASSAAPVTEIPDPKALLMNAFQTQVLVLCDLAKARGVEEDKVKEWKEYVAKNGEYLFNEFAKLDQEKIRTKDKSYLFSFSLVDVDSVDTTNLEEVWEVLSGLSQNVTFNDLYKLCPSTMITKISQLAMNISGRIESGEMSAKDLNPMEIGTALTSAMSKEDLAEFGKSISGANLNLPGMMGLMNAMMKKI